MYYKQKRGEDTVYFCKMYVVPDPLDSGSDIKWWKGIIFLPHYGGVLSTTSSEEWEKITKKEFVKGAREHSTNPTPTRTPKPKEEDDKVSKTDGK